MKFPRLQKFVDFLNGTKNAQKETAPAPVQKTSGKGGYINVLFLPYHDLLYQMHDENNNESISGISDHPDMSGDDIMNLMHNDNLDKWGRRETLQVEEPKFYNSPSSYIVKTGLGNVCLERSEFSMNDKAVLQVATDFVIENISKCIVNIANKGHKPEGSILSSRKEAQKMGFAGHVDTFKHFFGKNSTKHDFDFVRNGLNKVHDILTDSKDALIFKDVRKFRISPSVSPPVTVTGNIIYIGQQMLDFNATTYYRARVIYRDLITNILDLNLYRYMGRKVPIKPLIWPRSNAIKWEFGEALLNTECWLEFIFSCLLSETNGAPAEEAVDAAAGVSYSGLAYKGEL